MVHIVEVMFVPCSGFGNIAVVPMDCWNTFASLKIPPSWDEKRRVLINPITGNPIEMLNFTKREGAYIYFDLSPEYMLSQIHL